MLLVLGGTTEGRKLAARLAVTGAEYTLSLAGRTSSEADVRTRVGGFGGVDGLAAYLREHKVQAVIDATHPFANLMHWNAFEACRRADVPLLRLARPGWRDHALAGTWAWVASREEALAAVGDSESVLLTVGRQEAARYASHPGRVIVRVAEASEEWRASIPETWEVLEARGPFSIDAERRLLSGVDVLVSKDSGGTFNEAKLRAANELGVRVVMIERPPAPPSETVGSIDDALRWVEAHLSPNAAT